MEKHIINFDGNELTVSGFYDKAEPETRDYPGSDAEFEVSTILYNGTIVHNLLGSCGDTLERIEIQVLNECYGHDYSL